ncbi:TetR/AcrR family transcriptional regulator [Companilactobacillus hulinensis]|uniref:TetR/AcrR family transcriptional regulator n=1 Tax=Companilactobacillus hulinensis TaxID=2486007 RepID=UPI000F7BA066|nr:TetR/AcrR family transcriptional regulator [Companilactobacillus hulinensis]
MVSKTFTNLSKDKQERIIKALLKEFSNYTLAEAQVSRIVKESGIARGAFYKYFDDLQDAYSYLYKQALREIHQNVSIDNRRALKPDEYVEQVREFVNRSYNSDYYALVKMHLLHNESLFISSFNDHLITGNEYFWATQVMIHDAIIRIMKDPSSQEMILKKLGNVLRTLAKEDD